MQDQPIQQTSLTATVFDPSPPLWQVGWPFYGMLLSYGVLGALAGASPFRVVMIAALTAALTLGAWPRRPPRQLQLVCKPGSVRLGRRGSVLHARDITGATTAMHEGKISLVLEHAHRKRRPIVISLPDERALHVVCTSLGIGHHGFGVVDVFAKEPPLTLSRHVLSAGALLALLGALVSGAHPDMENLFGAIAALGTALAGIVAVISSPPATVIRLTSQGVFVPSLSGSRFVLFSTIERVELVASALTITEDGAEKKVAVPTSRSRWVRFGMSDDELAHLASQIRAASDRAHGRFALKDEPSSSVELLRRQKGELLRDWFSRLDTLGIGSQGYRVTPLEASDLWKVLEDPEAEGDLRTGAARVLSRVTPDLRVRVVSVLPTIRDERVRKRVAASVSESVLVEEERIEELDARRQNRSKRA